MIKNEQPFNSNSLWSATANKEIICKPLSGNKKAEVVVVGGGYTGLSAALHLAEYGKNVVVLDSENPGWGASGRNGGQVNPGLKENPTEVEQRFGTDIGRRMVEMSSSAPDLVFSLIKKHKIQCDAVRSGWIRAAHNKNAFEKQKKRAEDWQRRGIPIKILNTREIQAMLGTSEYYGGSLDPRGGNLHPLNYALGLVEAAKKAGAIIYGQTKVTKISTANDTHTLHANDRTIETSKVLLCTNGYTDDLVSPLKKTIVPVHSVQVATSPLSDNILKSILPGKQAPSDTRRSLLYFRLDTSGRFIMGGRGAYSRLEVESQQKLMRQKAEIIYPQLKGVQWQYAWGGLIAVTQNQYPHLNILRRGIISGLGYNGRGVAMATAMGKVMAEWAMNVPREDLAFPLTLPRPIPFHQFSKLGVRATIAKYKLLDLFGL